MTLLFILKGWVAFVFQSILFFSSDLFFKYYTDIAVDGTLLFLVIYIYLKRTWFEMALLFCHVGSYLVLYKKAFFIPRSSTNILFFFFAENSFASCWSVNSQILIHFLLVWTGLFFALLSILYRNRMSCFVCCITILESINEFICLNTLR
jgi:hypothetical protein